MKTLHSATRMLPPGLLAALCAAAVCLPGCSTTELGGLVEVGMLASGQDADTAARAGKATSSMAGALAPITVEAERSLGSGIAVQAYSQIGRRYSDEELQRYVNMVGRTVAANGQRPELTYAFGVLDDPTPNAFAGPGGYIFITVGSLRAMRDEAELAGVLAHEVGHVAKKHMLQTYKRASFISALQQSAEAFDKDAASYKGLVDAATETLFDKGLDKKFEFEADTVGTEIATVSGYDPRGLVTFLKKLETMTDSKGGWFKTHPPLSERVSRLNALLAGELRGEKGVVQRERFQRMMSAHLK
jgi:beta-barrel assembly-enhancing protease